ncbi:MAG: hypothetical protein MUF28_01925 [Ignavibacterium sp.]|jgi:hypothetical protein|nr:hypothetical protein [Ignavibacterium sp.]
MKSTLVCILIGAFSFSFAQQIPDNIQTEKYFISAGFRSNITNASNIGMGLKLSFGYNINDDFSLLFSSGYMTSYTNPYSYTAYRIWDSNANDFLVSTFSSERQDHRFIPVDLSLRYNFNVFGLQSYALVQAGLAFPLNQGNYRVSTLTKYESSNQLIESTSGLASDLNGFSKTGPTFGMGFGFGALIPISNSLKLDASYLFLTNPGMHSIGLGLNFGIK